MSTPEYAVRRATLDDLAQLTALWETMRFPVADLSRRVTEFQVVTDSEGQLVGAVGLQMAERQGRIHSEGFRDFSLADQLRPRLWERLNSLAQNHGLLRLWTQEDAPFWSRCGLQRADDEIVKKLPLPWREPNGSWLTLKLRDDIDTLAAADQEFAAFIAAEKLRTNRTLQRAKLFKTVASLIAGVLLLVIIGAIIFLFRNHARLPHR